MHWIISSGITTDWSLMINQLPQIVKILNFLFLLILISFFFSVKFQRICYKWVTICHCFMFCVFNLVLQLWTS
uniref:Uncharacterized protein n=1 Tax=Anguilla anguilla TaxID=7936 RepID=A0A0E9RMH0_ANGAN